ncbi:pyruvate/2-oxoglutarate dehydrogenase complex, dihydrolipoamide dehydrogenase component [Thioflavicoccus mobilis 8321]|uniref:Soluble pyridine nucleotide transhydrogenase n=1 Tax=Thioflavicoccus mobilis 8321 TaxID=765912 RepID=L0GVM0_9GAMM|nr:Si-specific NAD(P)(+) transhydrogenase [Thioflavicoccus mobilis]AGA90813.1 pyruvate/2-oxoglutarate dehydrogenase complex, dihydrolipoamide dehydrogenase component [Thioflavicoccus mobilis 8321]
MSTSALDCIVIGTGPAGEGAAMKLAKSGLRVAVIESNARVGGGCTHWGTIPSKALRHSIQMLADYRRSPLFQHTRYQLEVEFPDLLRAADGVINDQVRTRYRHYRRNQVRVLFGRARFVAPERIRVERPGGGAEEFTARHFVIATGSRPYHPPDVDFGHPRVLDSDTILDLRHTPRSITIYGAGVIGCEYASIMSNLDVKVNLVNTRDRLLSFLDDEITDALSYHLRNGGVVIRHDEAYSAVEPSDDGVVLHCRSGKKLKTEVLLWANGRTGNTAEMGLEEIGLEPNGRGQLEVDERYRTALPHIYAVGDVAGPPALASASYDQGRFVGALISDGQSDWSLIEEFPTGIYTMPEISSIGRTERELTTRQVPYEVAEADFKSIARAQITGHTVGMLKILFHRETLEILGIHCFGAQAAEIVHIGQAIMSQKGSANSLRYFTETTFNYPTMAEAYRVAALNGLNRLF